MATRTYLSDGGDQQCESAGRPHNTPSDYDEPAENQTDKTTVISRPGPFRLTRYSRTTVRDIPPILGRSSQTLCLILLIMVIVAASVAAIVAPPKDNHQVSVRANETCPIVISDEKDADITRRACVMVAVGEDGVCSVLVDGQTREFRGIPCTHINDPSEIQCVCWSDPEPGVGNGECETLARTVSSGFVLPVTNTTCDGGVLTVYITRNLDKRFDQVSVRSEAVLAINTFGEIAETGMISFNELGEPVSVPIGIAWLTNATIISVENVFCSEDVSSEALCADFDSFVEAITTAVNSSQSCLAYAAVQRADDGETPEELYDIYCSKRRRLLRP